MDDATDRTEALNLPLSPSSLDKAWRESAYAEAAHNSLTPVMRLSEREKRFHEILEALPAAIYTTDAAGRITFYNRAAVELTGRRPDLWHDRRCISWRSYSPNGKAMPHDRCPLARAIATNRQILGTERCIVQELKGKIDMSFEADGSHCALAIPAADAKDSA